MKMFAYTNGRWVAGSKEPWLEVLASFMRPLGVGRGTEVRLWPVSHRQRSWKTRMGWRQQKREGKEPPEARGSEATGVREAG